MDGGVTFFKAELISGNSVSNFCVHPIFEIYFKVISNY
jgi:hypothetical protein